MTIGRAATNDIHIPEQHVSRQHARIKYDNGMFMISNLGSANGTFVNDQRIEEPYLLMSGDVIRLYVPTLTFTAVFDDEDTGESDASANALLTEPATLVGPPGGAHCRLIVQNGAQEGQEIPLLLDTVTVGRATSNATWEILLQDPSVSRPHARLENINGAWVVKDLGSSNGTMVNEELISDKGRILNDGDLVAFGAMVLLFRMG